MKLSKLQMYVNYRLIGFYEYFRITKMEQKLSKFRNFERAIFKRFFFYHKEKIVSFIFDEQINGLWSIDGVKRLKPLQRLHCYGFAFWKLIINTIIR